MYRFLRWVWWNAYYCWRPRPRDLRTWLARSMRCRPPWWRFRPHVWHNDAGGYWEVWFAEDRDYTERRVLVCDVSVSLETGQVVGLKVWDEVLKAKEAKP